MNFTKNPIHFLNIIYSSPVAISIPRYIDIFRTPSQCYGWMSCILHVVQDLTSHQLHIFQVKLLSRKSSQGKAKRDVQYISWFIHTRADSRFAPSQWETALLCNDVSHWLGASLESALHTCSVLCFWLILLQFLTQWVRVTHIHDICISKPDHHWFW